MKTVQILFKKNLTNEKIIDISKKTKKEPDIQVIFFRNNNLSNSFEWSEKSENNNDDDTEEWSDIEIDHEKDEIESRFGKINEYYNLLQRLFIILKL